MTMSVAGLERMITGSVAKRLTLSCHTGRQLLRYYFGRLEIQGVSGIRVAKLGGGVQPPP